MIIEHNDAIKLEKIVCNVFSCERGGMGGYIDADHFESAPFDAALIAIAPLWQKADPSVIENFLSKWEQTLRKNSCNSSAVQDYIKEFKEVLATLEQ